MSLLPYHKGNKTKFTNLLFQLIRHFVTAPRGMPSLPMQCRAPSLRRLSAKVLLMRVSRRLMPPSLRSMMVCKKNETDFYPQSLRDSPEGLIFRNRIAGGEPLTHDLDIVGIMHVSAVIVYEPL